jgi:hypothetical protein
MDANGREFPRMGANGIHGERQFIKRGNEVGRTVPVSRWDGRTRGIEPARRGRLALPVIKCRERSGGPRMARAIPVAEHANVPPLRALRQGISFEFLCASIDPKEARHSCRAVRQSLDLRFSDGHNSRPRIAVKRRMPLLTCRAMRSSALSPSSFSADSSRVLC